ncbi:MAG: EAL domain-containing protein [Treponema sp.]|jgi:EAL domain-containing protein (putative c-di-GMP-specific phosphodiesterase class I)/GGDEF domain-containing protein|nr:EAL domain-containing protein [Treponema sp.]
MNFGRAFFFVSFILVTFSTVIIAEPIQVGIFETEDDMSLTAKDSYTEFYNFYLTKIAEKTGWKYSYVPLDYDECFKRLEAGSIDLMYGIGRTEDRTGKFLYSAEQCSVKNILLECRTDDPRFHNGDRTAVNGAVVGIPDYYVFQESIFDKFLIEKNIKVHKKYYPDIRNLEKALAKKEIDLQLGFLFIPDKMKKVVYNLGPYSLYFVVSPAKPYLKTALDSAMRVMEEENPLYRSQFLLQHHSIPTFSYENITDEERSFIKNSKPPHVYSFSKSYPFSYFDSEGNFRGIYKAVFDKVSDISGMNFEFKRVSTAPENMIQIFPVSESIPTEGTGLEVSDPFADKSVWVISSPHDSVFEFYKTPGRSTQKQKLIFAVTEDTLILNPYFKKIFAPFILYKFNTPGECLDQVQAGNCNGAILDDFFLNTMYHIGDYPALSIDNAQNYTVPLCFGIRNDRDGKTLSILNKSIAQFPAGFLQQQKDEAGLFMEYNPSRDIIIRHYILQSAVILLVLAVFAFLFYRHAAKRYAHIANIDEITGLWNLTCFERACEKRLSGDSATLYVLVESDIRDFKLINKIYGIQHSNKMLSDIAQVMKTFWSSEAFFAHGYADHFYLFERIENEDEFLDKLQLSKYQLYESQKRYGYHMTMKFGVVFTGGKYGSDSIKDIIGKASYARKTIKSTLQQQDLVVFDYEMQQKMIAEEQITRSMVRAFENEEFFVVYQPKINVITGKTEGAEALVRWKDPEYGVVGPDKFISVLEKNGSAYKLDFYVYKRVFDFIKQQLQNGRKIVPISMNITRFQLDAEKFVKDFTELFSQYSIPPSLVELEIVERSENPERHILTDFTRLLHESGFKIAMDDFGSGESSLNMLKNIPVDTVKLDQEFLNEAESTKQNRIIISETIRMAKLLGKTTVCEGVEKASQVSFLIAVGCDLAQGFFYSRPLVREDFAAYIEVNV